MRFTFKVQKKNNELQDFDRNKIISGVIKSGGSSEDGEKVAQEVEKWLPAIAKNDVIYYNALKWKVLDSLRMVNLTAANNFADFKK